ncbi:MAG TPA: hypothetical protein VIL48_09910 [Acidimicrobiales bacterium]
MGAAAQATGAVGRRQRYLDLATELACRPPRSGLPSFPHAVAHIRIADVARTVGVTRSAVYRHWSTQEEFWADLTAYLASGGESAWLRTLVRTGDAVVADGTGEAARRALNRIQEELLADHQTAVRAALVAYPDVGPARERVAESERRLVAHVAGLVDRLRAARGCRFADGVTATDVALVLTALGEGFALVARVAPRALARTPVDGDGGGDRGAGGAGSAAAEPAEAGTGTGVGPAEARAGLGAEERPWLPLAFAARAVLVGLTAPPAGAQAAGDSVPGADALDAPGAGATAPARRSGAGANGSPAGDRRRDYLRAAARLARTHTPGAGDDPVPVLGHVTLAGLARETGDDRRRLYELWPSQSEFRLDLLTHLVARTCRELGDLLEPQGAGPVLPVADRLFAWLRGTEWLPAAFAFAPVAGRRAVHERARRAADTGRQALASSLARLVAAAGRRMRPGVSLDQLTLLVLALVAGAVRTLRTNPALWRTDVRRGGAEHTLFGLAVAALIEATTHPSLA